MDSSLVSTNSPPPSGGTASFLQLYRCPVILIFTIYIFSQGIVCVSVGPLRWLQRPSALAQSSRESVTAEKHRSVTGAKSLFMYAFVGRSGSSK